MRPLRSKEQGINATSSTPDVLNQGLRSRFPITPMCSGMHPTTQILFPRENYSPASCLPPPASIKCIGSGSFNFRWAEWDGFDSGYAEDLHTVRRYTCCEASVGIIIIIIEGFYPNVPSISDNPNALVYTLRHKYYSFKNIISLASNL